MEKTYDPKKVESEIYTMWEHGGYFTPKKVDKKTLPAGRQVFTMLLPLPNANDPMHMGHALFTIQDIMARYHRMKGDPTLWLPGGDHAGIETQYVFEKHLSKEGKSRFQFDRATLYQMIAEFVEKNKDINKNQMKRLGFSLDWTRYRYSLDADIISIVLETFNKLIADHLAYRDVRMVNYCTRCGTAFSDLEINHEEKEDLLYYLDYGSITIATARPETIFADVAVAVHPKDKRYTTLVGKTAIIPIINKEIPIIADDRIEKDFGSGVLKVTPAHDQLDFDIGKDHGFPCPSCISREGRLINVPEMYKSMKVLPARQKITDDLKLQGKLIKTEPLKHSVSICYRCKTTIEPMLIPQWFIKTKPLAKKAIEAVKKKQTVIKPLKRFETMYFEWLNKIEDWNISRQIVWGPRIPIWYCLDCHPDVEITFINTKKEKVQGTASTLRKTYQLEEIRRGIQSLIAPLTAKPLLQTDIECPLCHKTNLIQETDTFDTWFLSGQWPYSTLISLSGISNNQITNSKQIPIINNKKTQSNNRIIQQSNNQLSDFDYFYPTTVLDTLWDILFFWVARMMMLGIYRTGKVPFEIVHIHARVVDGKGQKMSKSKGNVIDPIKMVDMYGADALRMALVFGAAPGADISISEDKIRGMRNFANKLWNIGRFIIMNVESLNVAHVPVTLYDVSLHKKLHDDDKRIISELNMLVASTTHDIERYRFSDAAQTIYEFAWHRFADMYIEQSKDRLKNNDALCLATLMHVFRTLLKLLHPFMPFITEELWDKFPKKHTDPLIISSWPT
jgi:valyl-tRNA synthetase